MNIEKFADMLLKSIEKMEMPAADVQQIKTDNSLFGVEMPDDSQFLINLQILFFLIIFLPRNQSL